MDAVYLGDGKLLLKTAYGGKLLVPSADLSLTPDLALRGAHELPLTRYLLRHVRPGHRALDVGAHVGYFSVLLGCLVGPEGHVWSYEPHPTAYAYLYDNLSLNYLHDRVEAINRAAAAENGRLVFHASLRYLGNSSLHRHGEAYRKHYADEFAEIEVEAEALGSRENAFGTLDLVKLDIEGGEYGALLGMKALLPRRVRRLIFEINKGMLQDDWEPFARLLAELRDKHGKRFSLIEDDGGTTPVELARLLAGGSFAFVLME